MILMPAYFKTVYDLDHDRNHYVLAICPPAFTRTPSELIVELRQTDVIRADADLILKGSRKTVNEDEAATTGKGKRTNAFFTGLLPTDYADLYGGNVLTFGRAKKKIKNYIMVRFTPNAEQLTILYFPGWRPYPNDRAAFIREVMGRGLI